MKLEDRSYGFWEGLKSMIIKSIVITLESKVAGESRTRVLTFNYDTRLWTSSGAGWTSSGEGLYPSEIQLLVAIDKIRQAVLGGIPIEDEGKYRKDKHDY